MYRVEARFAGEALWRAGGMPLTLQAAQTQAKALSGGRLGDQARIVPTEPTRRLDLRV